MATAPEILGSDAFARTRRAAAAALLARRVPAGHWTGRLSSSALSTATAITALGLVDARAHAATAPDTDGPLQHLSNAARAFEREYLLRALRVTAGKRQAAADLLGISRKNLWEKLRAHGLSDTNDVEE